LSALINKETLSRNGDSERSVLNGEKRVLKLGLDAYYRQVTVATQEHGGRIKASGKMGYGFDNWMQKKLDEGWEIYSCYEAGATGYWLHRQMDGGHRLHRMGLADVLGARL
jgi:hypothetical protein